MDSLPKFWLLAEDFYLNLLDRGSILKWPRELENRVFVFAACVFGLCIVSGSVTRILFLDWLECSMFWGVVAIQELFWMKLNLFYYKLANCCYPKLLLQFLLSATEDLTAINCDWLAFSFGLKIYSFKFDKFYCKIQL